MCGGVGSLCVFSCLFVCVCVGGLGGKHTRKYLHNYLKQPQHMDLFFIDIYTSIRHGIDTTIIL